MSRAIIFQATIINMLLGLAYAGLLKQEENEDKCQDDQFQCLHLNLNQILTIHEWNRRPRECIPLYSRCDGRHDCQDGSDEVECLVELPRKTRFRCYVGENDERSVEDCTERDKRNPSADPKEKPRSVSELKEWVCSKYDKPDGTVSRDCMRLYTGGEAFRVCYTNAANGSTCLCSRELCNNATKNYLPFQINIFLLLFVTLNLSLS